jgi:anhydro-N-acetylmuramic acid kinase
MMNYKDWLSAPRTVCGVMTGTSLDGIDVAVARFSDTDGKHSYELIDYHTFDFPAELKSLAMRIIHEQIHISEFSEFSYLLARAYTDSVKQLVSKSKSDLKIDALGVHGQTLWHRGEPTRGAIYAHPASLQAISFSAMAKWLQIPVVGNFREADTALGGHGAPLVPIFDYEFFRSKDENIICLNIGGISNITILPKNCSLIDLQAFDTGPGNVLIDNAMNILFDLTYDKSGAVAQTGTVSNELTNELKRNRFITQKPPKSTGREMFTLDYTKDLINKYSYMIQREDFITTFANFTAVSIAENIKLFSIPVERIICSGGGANNEYLMKSLKEMLPGCELVKSDVYNLPGDSKEAVCFAYLAYRALGGLPGNIPSVTGAEKETILGVVAY